MDMAVIVAVRMGPGAIQVVPDRRLPAPALANLGGTDGATAFQMNAGRRQQLFQFRFAARGTIEQNCIAELL